MKKILCLLALAGTLSLTSCVASRNMEKINRVETGMYKDDVRTLLGSPKFRNGNTYGEEWRYDKMVSSAEGPEIVEFIVVFNEQGRVVEYRTLRKPQMMMHRK